MSNILDSTISAKEERKEEKTDLKGEEGREEWRVKGWK